MALPSNVDMQAMVKIWEQDQLLQPYMPKEKLDADATYAIASKNVRERMKALKMQEPPAEMLLNLRTFVLMICGRESLLPGDQTLKISRANMALAKESAYLYPTEQKASKE